MAKGYKSKIRRSVVETSVRFSRVEYDDIQEFAGKYKSTVMAIIRAAVSNYIRFLRVEEARVLKEKAEAKKNTGPV
jgi:predicted DNA-binding ribbon-helix-helix protein